jgi:hypothetical protein
MSILAALAAVSPTAAFVLWVSFSKTGRKTLPPM